MKDRPRMQRINGYFFAQGIHQWISTNFDNESNEKPENDIWDAVSLLTAREEYGNLHGPLLLFALG